jgi:hypothetical protein
MELYNNVPEVIETTLQPTRARTVASLIDKYQGHCMPTFVGIFLRLYTKSSVSDGSVEL